MIVLVGIGSNLGAKQKNCEQAIVQLKNHPQISVLKTSHWYETKAVCLPSETHPDFINGVCALETSLDPEHLFKTLKTIEKTMGRGPTLKKWQSRLIDLDLLFYGGQIIEAPHLKIPHPLAHERLFVLEPLHEIAPDFVHPILKKTVAELYQDVLKNTPS